MSVEEQQYVRVGAQIRRGILSGEFVFGERLKIDDLANRYGTSHMPIREALKMLSGEGLIDMMPNRGVRVRTLDSTFITNLFDIRISIEALQTRLAASRRTKKQMEDISSARLSFEQIAAKGDVDDILAANQKFHHSISLASGNLEASSIESRHWRILPAIWTTSGYPKERLPIVIDDHRLMEQLIREGDTEGASTLAAAHCLRAKLHMIIAFNARPA